MGYLRDALMFRLVDVLFVNYNKLGFSFPNYQCKNERYQFISGIKGIRTIHKDGAKIVGLVVYFYHSSFPRLKQRKVF